MSEASPRLDLRPDHWAIVLDILRQHVPDRKVLAFGSRATWTAKNYSDLDLAILGNEPLSLDTTSALAEDFEEADLPFKVDIVDWARTDETFHTIIRRDGVIVQNPARFSESNISSAEWSIATIEAISEKVAMGPFGSSIKVKTFVPEGVPIISGQHLHNTKVDDNLGYNFITREHAQRLKNANVRCGDIIFTHAGNIGQVAYIPENSQFSRYVISQRQFYMRCDRTRAIAEFVTAYFKSPEGQHKLLANASQVGVPSIAQPVTYLRTVEIPVPPLPEQHAIAYILGTLDDKIELNRRMNETLEAMAHALFKSWFVDFDPVRAKMALNHSPLEGESQSDEPPGDSGCGGGTNRRSPQASRWGEIKRSYSEKTLNRAKSLRQNQTDAEVLLWHYLRNKQLDGYKFRRQQPIGPYIIDFACLPEKLLIELDGGQHAEREGYDEQRDRFLQSKGYRVLRFWNNEVFENCFDVLEQIYQALTSPDYSPHEGEPTQTTHHSPIEGESANQGPVPGLTGERQPAGAPVGGNMSAGNQVAETNAPPPHQPSPHGSPSATPPQGGSDWTVERARAYLDRMDPKIADLFPDRLVNSEIGEIPEGWAVGYLSDIASSPRRSINPANLEPGTPSIGLDHMPRYSIALTEWQNSEKVTSNKFAFKEGEFLFGKLRPYFHKVGIAPVNGICSTDIVVIAPIETAWSAYVLATISSFEFVNYTDQTSTGTKMPRTSWGIMSSYTLCLPPERLVQELENATEPMLGQVVTHVKSNRSLALLRDTLLPKLISGEIRLCNTDQTMEAVV